ncbi:MAG: hypothetical protein AAFV25_22400, partial [Bacteroidota bacterium]
NDITATDDCDTDVDIQFLETRIDGDCENSYSLLREWTATDNCGNAQTESQLVLVEDRSNPVLQGIPADATVECNDIPQAPLIGQMIAATDLCDTNVVITFSELRTDGNCEDQYTLTRIWTATDDCGNQAEAIQNILVMDRTVPVLVGVPADVTVACNSIPNPANPTASDNCDTDVQIDYLEVRTDGNCPDSYVLTRTWTATDNCGNQATQSQRIEVRDDRAPSLAGVPADIQVACDALPEPALVVATDDCDTDVQIDFVEVRMDGSCPDGYTLTRTWTATDNCGNQSSQSQRIEVSDQTAPILTGVPADQTVECDNIPAAANPSATDDCDANVDIQFVETRTDGDCSDAYALTRTWTATDNCGNATALTQVVQVLDRSRPILLGLPADLTVTCDDIPSVATPTATDNCDTDVSIDFIETKVDGDCPGSYVLRRSWTATDNCGNQDVRTQVVTVQDNLAPVLSAAPADVTVSCESIPAAAQLTASDNCEAEIEVEFLEVRTNGNCTDAYTLVRTWTATDACGNQDVKTQTIEVKDEQAPLLTGVPADITTSCDDLPAIPQIGQDVTATDNCDASVDIAFVESRTDADCANSYTLLRTWAATDNCGNATRLSQRILVQDEEAPVLTGVGGNLTVSCENVPQPPVIGQDIQATDNCDGTVNIRFEETRTADLCTDSYDLIRTWTATDLCGNQTVQTQLIQVRDEQAPIMSGVPANLRVSCESVPAPAQPTATDNCDTNISIDFQEVRTAGNCPDAYSLTRTWTATDNCGNQDVQSQTIEVFDDSAPILSGVPADISIACGQVPPAANPVATDNCDLSVDVNFVEVRTDGDCGNSYTLTRRWTATDNCGNQTVRSQVIVVGDEEAPLLTGVPADVTVACGQVPTPANPTVSDNCDTDVDIEYVEVRTDGDCPHSYTLTRSWTATDAC